MDPISIFLVVGSVLNFIIQVAAIVFVAWIALEVCKAVGSYLREKKREIGILYKRRAIDALIKATEDEDVKRNLRCIREHHMGLFVPLDANDDAVQADVCSMKAKNYGRDDIADMAVVADDDSMSPLMNEC